MLVVMRIFVYEGKCVFAVVPMSGLLTSVQVCIGGCAYGFIVGNVLAMKVQ